MTEPTTMTYAVDGRIARITLNRPDKGNAINHELPGELSACIERANLNPAVHVIALAGNGSGFCGGYDLGMFAEANPGLTGTIDEGAPNDPAVTSANHDPNQTWDPMVDYANDEPQCPPFHEPVPQRQTGRLQSSRVLRRRRHGHGTLFGFVHHRKQGKNRLSPRACMGFAHDVGLGVPHRYRKGEAAPVHRRLPLR
jgi:hypothetical protein